MYFLWKTTQIGIIRVSCDGLKDFAEDILRSRVRLYSITLSPEGREGEADVSIVLSEEDIAPEAKKTVEEHFPAVFKPMGMRASVIWAVPERNAGAVVSSPHVWAGAASSLAVLVTAGAAGFFWVMFWGAAAWFVVHGLNILVRKFRRA